MLIESLRLRDFRNFGELHLEPDARFNLIEGPNGQGKTNLLEAIYILAALKSFRTSRNAAVIRDGAEEALCEAWVDRGGVRREVSVTLGPRSRKIRLNGSSVRKLDTFFGTVNIVSFTPEDVRVMRASPADRRAFLDRMIFNANPTYALEIADYETALKNRNALIRDGVVQDRDLLDIYDQQVALHGARIAGRRFSFVENFQHLLVPAFQEIFGEDYEARLHYQPSFVEEDSDPEVAPTAASLEASMLQALKGSLRRDLQRGYTTVGPHRDDIEGSIDGQPMREYASQGQHRSFVLAMKISEIRHSAERHEHSPILLLDDVSSELDPQRNARLFDFLSTMEGQVFITTTDASFIRLHQPAKRWKMQAGALSDV